MIVTIIPPPIIILFLLIVRLRSLCERRGYCVHNEKLRHQTIREPIVKSFFLLRQQVDKVPFLPFTEKRTAQIPTEQ